MSLFPLFLFNFKVLINHENHKKNSKKKNLEDKKIKIKICR
jgi:hypothetical protein